jgi:seryl-tRNA synthetase
MLDINLFREDKGYDPQEIRESQKRRGASVELVDQVIAADKKWRQCECWSFSSLLSVVCAVVQ